MNKTALFAAAGMVALAARFSGGAEASAPSNELRNHPDFDHYSAALAQGSPDGLRKFLIERPASPFIGLVFAQLSQQIECDPNDPNVLLENPECAAPIATAY